MPDRIKELLEQMKQQSQSGDTEDAHVQADWILVKTLQALATDETRADIDEHDNLPCMAENDLYLLTAYGTSGRGWQRPIDASGCRLDCPRCQNRLRYVIEQRRQTILIKARMAERVGAVHTVSLPLCARCGAAHDRRTLSGDAATYCQHCDDLNAVESFWKYRGIFGSDDDETILDRIQKSHPGLFERGVLPDLWFLLQAKL